MVKAGQREATQFSSTMGSTSVEGSNLVESTTEVGCMIGLEVDGGNRAASFAEDGAVLLCPYVVHSWQLPSFASTRWSPSQFTNWGVFGQWNVLTCDSYSATTAGRRPLFGCC